MKRLALVFSFFCFSTFATTFNCTSYGLVDVYVKGSINEDFVITIIDLPFTETFDSVQEVDFDQSEDETKFHLSASGVTENNDPWFLSLDTQNGSGIMKMSYRGVRKNSERVYCEFN